MFIRLASQIRSTFVRACYEEFMQEMTSLATANRKLYVLAFKLMNEIPDFDTVKTAELGCIRSMINKSWTNVALCHPQWAVKAVAKQLVRTGMLDRKHRTNRYHIYKALMSLHNRQTAWEDTWVD